MESSPPRSNSTAPVAGVKRPASLLPAFEPLSSSPSLPRPQKRVAREDHGFVSTYPTPVPTSSTHIMSSSPPRMALPRNASRRNLASSSSERTPLSAVPTLMLPESGDPILMGRSSVSCHHQLAANRMISRVHVKAAYKPAPNPFDRDRIEIMCMGWNGIKLHCQGKTYDLAKGKTFTSDIKDADIMIDVHDARILVQWPRNERKDYASTDSDHTWEESTTPKRNGQSHRSLQDSPSVERQRLASPVSPSPAVKSLIPPSSPLYTPTRSRNAVVVYEDEEASPVCHNGSGGVFTAEITRQTSSTIDLLQSSQSSDLSDLSKTDELSDHDEENDPIIHSFGPFGENLLPRLASFTANVSPLRSTHPRNQPSQPLQPTQSPRQPSTAVDSAHVASSKLEGPSREQIRSVIESTKCIGKVAREGKDAAGKPLESEYYYIPDFDEDDMRREAVVHDLRKPGLRNCRKQHKQYFWRKPK
ncbi:putative transcription factor Tos4 [Aspergillus tanneri]|uniref:FHA domain-containing protein n=1 Tax=Aspergillus tanneri TaxID=1220188 RepID=A0A5M9MND3_9EURO|nr:uncharacterized protein ATNIH1004_005633 [Aspergillus tanneri]KAA8646954.1 hypothetical protein ATNIH1004_005633 [Aspergillus tanneri]